MRQDDTHPHRAPKAALALAAVLAAALALAAGASAAYEQTGIFAGTEAAPEVPGVFGEEVQLGGVTGMAVNYTGAGGVPKGTVYAATNVPFFGFGVAMYVPSGEGLEFAAAWSVRAEAVAYERCGPLVASSCAPRVQALAGGVDVNVDQATGNVYAFNGNNSVAGRSMVVEYKADGAEEITRFGVKAENGKTTAETPTEIHLSYYPGGIAVDGAGTVYVFDVNTSDNYYHRLMVFKPESPEDFAHYEYAGQVAAAFGLGSWPLQPVADAAGHIYIASAGEGYVEEYDPSRPEAGPICSFSFAKGGITAVTVDPLSEEVFFFSEKKTKAVHRLAPCDEEGKFVEVESVTVAPERDDLYGLAFDPARQLSPARSPGVLYGGAPEAEPAVGKGQPGRGSLGYIFSGAEELFPTVSAEAVSRVSASGALLHAEVDPESYPTHYVFQYLSEAAYLQGGESFAGAAEAPLGGGDLEGAKGAVAVAAAIAGLDPDTAYRYRLVASSHCSPEDEAKVCEEAGPAAGFHTFAVLAPGLPDRRAYELVSPAQKNGGQVVPADSGRGTCGRLECKPGNSYTRFPMQSSPDGGAIVYEGTPFSPVGGAVAENQYIARRDPAAGWSTTNLTPLLLASKDGGGYKAFDPTLGSGLFQQRQSSLAAAAPSEYPDLYTQPTAAPLSLDPLLTAAPPNRAPGSGSGSLKLSYAGASTDLSRVFFEANDALSGPTPYAPAPGGGPAGETNLYEWAGGRLALVNVDPGNATSTAGAKFGAGQAVTVAQAISADGSHAYWSSGAGQLYVRIDAQQTREIHDPGAFLSASADGSEVLLDDGCLYSLATEECEDLTLDSAETHQGGFEGILGQSEDLARVYFVDTAVLSGEEENEAGEKAQPGKPNLYLWDRGATSFVSTLLATDNSNTSKAADWRASPSARTAQASPNGRWVAFLSTAPLTGYGNAGPCEHTGGGETLTVPCQEAFLYDSATGKLRCPSCDPSGAAPLGDTVLRRIEGAISALPQPRYLTDSGRLYFDSPNSLLPTDTNEGVEDVYQFEPGGVGGCQRPGGCVALISAGSGELDSNFLAIDTGASSVFFTTRDQLALKDRDELVNLYVAREGGGIPAESETARGECQGEACQPSPRSPSEATPASAAFAGAGNLKEGDKPKRRCPKGKKKVKRHGKARCVKRHKAHRRHKRHARRAGRNRGARR